jgi:hypothetical protein
MIQKDQILDLINEMETEDPIDWGMLSIDEQNATDLLVSCLVEKYNTEWTKFTQEDQTKMFLASMGKLIVENFVLNVKLRQ